MNNTLNTAFLSESVDVEFCWTDAIPAGVLAGVAFFDKIAEVPVEMQGAVSGVIIASSGVTGIQLVWRFFRAKFVEFVSVRDGNNVIYMVRLRRLFKGRQ